MNKFLDGLAGIVGVVSIGMLVLGGLVKFGLLHPGDSYPFDQYPQYSWWTLILLAAVSLFSIRYLIIRSDLKNLQRVNHLLRSDVAILTLAQVVQTDE